MFMAADRLPKMRAMILAADEAGRRAALDELLPLQQADFEGLFHAMGDRPVTIRLLDPPLHEFVPDHAELREANPMLGTRGVRLGLLHPEIYEMQTRAIVRAARAVRARTGRAPQLEIMIPLVAYAGELEAACELVRRVAAAEGADPVAYATGTMIELPRACLAAGEIARSATVFSFGTNDLTQTALGFSRDDIEASILPLYVDRHIVERSPFWSIDEEGVGELIEIAIARGRRARPDLETGICGEHGGDPASIRFFRRAGLDYVSCSPFRIPVARVAAAQADQRLRVTRASAAAMGTQRGGRARAHPATGEALHRGPRGDRPRGPIRERPGRHENLPRPRGPDAADPRRPCGAPPGRCSDDRSPHPIQLSHRRPVLVLVFAAAAGGHAVR
jgi:pyruvate, orthophosphate dikinase